MDSRESAEAVREGPSAGDGDNQRRLLRERSLWPSGLSAVPEEEAQHVGRSLALCVGQSEFIKISEQGSLLTPLTTEKGNFVS